MSLVNDMLRDLDRRRSRPQGVSRISAAIPLELEEKKGQPWLLVAMVLAGVILGMLAGLYLFQQNNEQSFPLAAVQEPAQVPAVAVPAEMPAAAEQERVLASSAPPAPSESSPATAGLSSETAESVLAVNPVVPEAVKVPEESLSQADYAAAPVSLPETDPYRAAAPVAMVQENTPPDTSVTSIRQPAAAASQNSTPVRISRELSPTEQDLRTSREAVQLIERGQLQAAFNTLYLFVARNPEAHQSRETLATLLLAQQEFRQAEMVVEEGLSLVPNHPAFKKIKARLLSMSGQVSEATSLLREGPPRVVDDYEYHELLAALLQHDGQHERAISTYQELLRFDSRQARWWAGLAISLEASGSIGEAISGYQAALQLPGLDTDLRQYSQSRISYLNN